MALIAFKKHSESVRFKSPLKNMEPVEVEIERRLDPLTGRAALWCESFQDKVGMFFAKSDYQLLEELAAQTRERCFFCPEKVKAYTPRYEESWLKGGALERGECFLFPNLFPLSALHAVIVVGKKHLRLPDDFPPQLLQDAFSLAVEFGRSVHRADPQRRYLTVNTNYLPPAGASLLHPHLQLFGGKYPPTAVEELQKACREFQNRLGRPYFETLVEEEKSCGERYIFQTGPVHWLAAFAPAGANEILGVAPGYFNLLELDDRALGGLAEGLSRALAFFHRQGFSSFNYTIYSDTLEGGGAFPVFLRLVCRQNFARHYHNDDYFLQKMLGDELILIKPETLAEQLRSTSPVS
jgi:UDPglucose--hexose-1-phosphate uridylyltransferase